MTPDRLRHRLEEAAAYYNRGDVASAARACEDVLRAKPDEPNAMLIMGNILAQRGDLDNALLLLEGGRRNAPSNVHLLNSIGIVQRRRGVIEDAKLCFQLAIAADRRFAPAHYNLGNVLRDQGDDAGARRAYTEALALKPDYADAMAGLAAMAESERDLAGVRSLALAALAQDPKNIVAHLGLARADMAEDLFEAVLDRLEPLTKDTNLGQTNRSVIWGLIGEANDRLERYDEAFAAFDQANRILHQMHAPALAKARASNTPATVARLRTFFEALPTDGWRPSMAEAGPTPVFLVGFPRSGTTLLEQVLASHPAIAALEERDNLVDGVRDFILPDDGPARLATLSDSETAHYRDAYWTRVRSFPDGRRDKPVFVDKMPLNTVLLPLIHRLFPRAKIVFAVRDPRDVVTSCFQQRFGMNAPMFQFLKLDTTAAFYDSVMALAEIYRRVLPLDVHGFRYEDLIADFDGTVERLLSFLGLPWDDRVRDYRTTAAARRIGTPSASQVIRPLYTTSQGKWRNYRTQLAPYLPLLDRWVQAYGYAAS